MEEGNAGQLPSTHERIHDATLIQQSFAAAKRQFVDIAEHKPLPGIRVTPAAVGGQVVIVLRRCVAQPSPNPSSPSFVLMLFAQVYPVSNENPRAIRRVKRSCKEL